MILLLPLSFQFTAQDSFALGINIAQLAVGVAGLAFVGLFSITALQYRQRATNKFLSSLLSLSKFNVSKIDTYYPRHSTEKLNIIGAYRSVAIIGDNRSGKTTLISHSILHEMFPWWSRFFFPPRGLFLEGDQKHATIDDWLKNQLATNNKEDPMGSVLDLVLKRYVEQRIRFFLYTLFGERLPRLLKPQPTIIIVDQAEELLRKYRGKFLVEFYKLAKKGRDTDAFRLVLIINTENAVESLKLINGGNMFEVVRAPKVTKDAVLRYHGKEFAQIFEDCDNCIGIAEDFVTEKPSVSAREFFNMRKQQYERDSCLLQAISRAEYNKLTTMDPDPDDVTAKK